MLAGVVTAKISLRSGRRCAAASMRFDAGERSTSTMLADPPFLRMTLPQAAQALRGIVRVGAVNADTHRELSSRFGIRGALQQHIRTRCWPLYPDDK